MKHICELQDILEQYFNWNKSRLTVLANLVLGLFLNKTVNLSEHAMTFSSRAQVSSNYKRLQRFFNWLIRDNSYQYLVMKLVIAILNLKNRKNDLALDRTDWKFGKKHLNILVLGVNYKGISIPLAWISLGRAGNSKTVDRMLILQKVMSEIPIHSFTADREFIGEEWFKFLIHSQIPFFIRIKEDTQVLRKNGNYTIALRDLFKNLRNARKSYLKECSILLGVEVSLAACRNLQGELLIVITNACPRSALKMYKKRWAIETLFSYLKTKGFGWEDTHMTDPKKIGAWMLILTLAVVWTLKTNQLTQSKPIFAKHGRKRKSIFRCCFEIIRKYLTNSHQYMEELLLYINLLKQQKHALNMA